MTLVHVLNAVAETAGTVVLVIAILCCLIVVVIWVDAVVKQWY